MSKATELLNSLSGDVETAYPVNDDHEEHIVIGADRVVHVPESLRKIAVQHDHNVETVTFDCPRYWDGRDMSKMVVYINYLLPNGKPGAYIADNLRIDDTDSAIIHFDWTISGYVSQYVGTITFLVCIKKVDLVTAELINHWNSELNTELYVTEGLECVETVVIPQVDILTQLLGLGAEIGRAVVDADKATSSANAAASRAETTARDAEGMAVYAYEAGNSARAAVGDVTAAIDRLDSVIADAEPVVGLFDYLTPANLLDPSNSESGLYMNYSLESVSDENALRTVEPISCDGNDRLYVRSNLTGDEGATDEACRVMFMNKHGLHTTTISIPFKYIESGESTEIDIPFDAVSFHFWESGVSYGVDFSNICLTFVELTDFNVYHESKHVFKHNALPNDVFYRPLRGKTIVNFGDGILAKASPPKDISTMLSSITGATVHNCGFEYSKTCAATSSKYHIFSMQTLADAIVTGDFTAQDEAIAYAVPEPYGATLNLLKSINFSHVDIITISYGIDDLDDWWPPYDELLYGLNSAITRILDAFPHIRVFICSPTYRVLLFEGGDLMVDSDAHSSPSGYMFTEYVEMFKQVAQELRVPYIDNYYELGINRYNYSAYFSYTGDGLADYNKAGRELIARHIANHLF